MAVGRPFLEIAGQATAAGGQVGQEGPGVPALFIQVPPGVHPHGEQVQIPLPGLSQFIGRHLKSEGQAFRSLAAGHLHRRRAQGTEGGGCRGRRLPALAGLPGGPHFLLGELVQALHRQVQGRADDLRLLDQGGKQTMPRQSVRHDLCQVGNQALTAGIQIGQQLMRPAPWFLQVLPQVHPHRIQAQVPFHHRAQLAGLQGEGHRAPARGRGGLEA